MAMPPGPNSASQGINIEAWTEDAVASISLSTATVSAAMTIRESSERRSTSVTIEIPLDAEAEKSQTQQKREIKELRARLAAQHDASSSDPDDTLPSGYVRRRSGGEPRRRDSMKRREALLKGKEGSRRRQKWENDHLVGNPALQPPEPHDWAPHPTHRVHNVPYVLAPLWDQHYAAASRVRAEKAHQVLKANSSQTHVPRELREKLKRSRGAKSLLQDLEEQVRDFVKDWEEKQQLRGQGWDVDIEADSEAESSEGEVVFVGRRDSVKPSGMVSSGSAKRHMLVFDSLEGDKGASFRRWLVHSIASYYNLQTWSRTIGDPARREAYVGIPDKMDRDRPRSRDSSAQSVEASTDLPRPLWVMV